jgi:hypothetical protein
MDYTAKTFDFAENIPPKWPLVPVRGKRPYDKDWQNNEYTLDQISCELDSGRASGFGLLLGRGLLAIDIDGASAWAFLLKFGQSADTSVLTRTTSWSSNRDGHRQILLAVSPEHWNRIRCRKILTGSAPDGTSEYLEIRWIGQQSVLPPSIHPLTGKPYVWINNPIDCPPLSAPDWVLDICQFGIDQFDHVRFPARLYSYFGRQMGIWLLARRFDFIYKGNTKFVGSGVGRFTITAASVLLRRSPSRVRRLLSDAKNSGLIRNYKQRGDWVKVFYSSLENAIAIAKLDSIGPIASISVDSLPNLHIFATEIEAQSLQRTSLYRQGKDESAQGSPLHKPEILLSPSVHLAGVIDRGRRFVYCDRNFRFYGGSQAAIAKSRGLTSSTVSRHLSNSYRLAASPVRKFRQELPPIIKKQLAEHLPGVQIFSPKFCAREGLLNLGENWYRPRCNVYLLNHQLVAARRRRRVITERNTGGFLIDKAGLWNQKNFPGGLIDNFSLYIPDPREINKRILANLENDRKIKVYRERMKWHDTEAWRRPKRQKNQDKKPQK